MGYTTEFEGSFRLDRPLTPEHATYLRRFAETRRMQRDATKADQLPDPVRLAVGLPVGADGAYFVGGAGSFGQNDDDSIGNYNCAPHGQPGLWCQWVPNDEGTEIVWDEGEKFYEYTAWLEYLIANFLRPWGYTLNGKVRYRGEDDDDRGAIYCENNTVRQVADTIIPA